jgi:hypothetical protein
MGQDILIDCDLRPSGDNDAAAWADRESFGIRRIR